MGIRPRTFNGHELENGAANQAGVVVAVDDWVRRSPRFVGWDSRPAPKVQPWRWLPPHPITAKVINVARVGEQYCVGVQVGRDNYSGTFDRLKFGEHRPQTGWYCDGWLDLAYHGDPGFRAGQSFPLWDYM
jgi:hypothetical protein